MSVNNKISLIITDFDGTLVDTKQANFQAYSKILSTKGINLTKEKYYSCYGLRLKEFMSEVGIIDDKEISEIKLLKSEIYPDYFSLIKLNKLLLNFLKAFKYSGKIAIATTAQRNNVKNVLSYFGLVNLFDYILTGEDIKFGKPNPECYLKIMTHFRETPVNTLIFEDSPVGIAAAQATGASYILVNNSFYGN